MKFSELEQKIIKSWEILSGGKIIEDLENERVYYFIGTRKLTWTITNDKQKAEFIRVIKTEIREALNRG